MKRFLNAIFILLFLGLILISTSCKGVTSKSTIANVNSSVSETKEVAFLTYSGEEFPKPIGYVSDYENIIDQGYEDKIMAEVKKVKEETNADIVVVTIKSLEGKSIDDYTLELFNTWGINSYAVILLISMDEKKLRITTGYDMEKVITSDIAKYIVDDVIVPKFKQSDYSEGIYQGVMKISEFINGEGIVLETEQQGTFVLPDKE